MRLSHLLTAAATLSLIAAPAFAAPQNRAAKLSLARQDDQGGGGGSARARKGSGATTAVVAGVAVAAVVIGAVALSHKDSKAASA